MRHGVVLFTSDRGIAPADLAIAAEQRGFDTIYVPEHTHIPVRREAAHPTAGADLPDDRYLRTLDPWVALATCATVTKRIGLSTAVALPAESDPIAGRDGEPEVRILVASKPSRQDLADWATAGASELMWGVPDAESSAVQGYLDRLALRLGLSVAGAVA